MGFLSQPIRTLESVHSVLCQLLREREVIQTQSNTIQINKSNGIVTLEVKPSRSGASSGTYQTLEICVDGVPYTAEVDMRNIQAIA